MGVSTKPRPLYPRENPCTHCTGGQRGTSARVGKISPPTGIRFPYRPAYSQSLYRQNYWNMYRRREYRVCLSVADTVITQQTACQTGTMAWRTPVFVLNRCVMVTHWLLSTADRRCCASHIWCPASLSLSLIAREPSITHPDSVSPGVLNLQFLL